MKKNIFLIVFAVISFAVTAQAQSCCSSKAKTSSCTKKTASVIEKTSNTSPKAVLVANVSTHNETVKFVVYGNCGMCEKTIEGALKDVKGVVTADWDRETDQMTVTFNPHKISLDAIKQKIADVGYDSETHRAKDEVYNSLPGCCQYERPTSKNN